MKIKYTIDEKDGSIKLPKGPPFDGKPVLIKLAAGWVEAWWEDGQVWHTPEGTEYGGFHWICLDDDFHAELDDAKEWLPLPVTETATHEEKTDGSS